MVPSVTAARGPEHAGIQQHDVNANQLEEEPAKDYRY